ncbi:MULTISPECIES: hypothetical protein [Marinobacter]|jgi:hypothetical protein|uniref:hypothetical protein n=1 Tax=Marinobacter TaxID=2742 RepID=UPI00110833C0|nr:MULTISPECIES: hypothetical protein [Marinobacter]MCK2149044.1 hypothetical protein [Marinobacter alexandrii]
MRSFFYVVPVVALALPFSTQADEVILDDLIVQSSLCAGEDCVVDAEFGFDTLRLQSPTPQILFQDTSTSASFPTQDWVMGISDGGTAMPSSFFIKNLTTELTTLMISPEGDVALGAGAEVVEGAVSVGDLGMERRVTSVADAVDDSDAVTLSQFNAFKTTATASVSTEVTALETRLSELESRLTDLVERLEAVAAQVN